MLIGHTGDEVKMHYFEGGGCIGRFPLATNEDYVNRTTGERVSNTEWHNIVVVDGNVYRVLSRVFGVDTPIILQKGLKNLRRLQKN